MSSQDTALIPASLDRSSLVLPVFAAALFVSATLMFEVQPMFTRMVLPVLGGSPGVWSIAMVFFQAMLLAGYFYAHVLTRHVPLRMAALVHLTIMAMALLCLPIARASGFDQPPESGTAFWLIGLFGASVGLPFFALAGNGPLLQAWFARSGHRQANDPYFLYGASNLGSFAGLLLYPVLIEPTLRLAQQSQLWTLGFLVLGFLIAAASLLVVRRGGQTALAAAIPDAALAKPQILRFVGLAFVPSGLLVAVTAQLSTDVAAAPLLWVLPLALFLLTFVLAFRERPLLSHRFMLQIQPWLVGASVILAAGTSLFNMFAAIGLMLANYFVCAMVAHGELFRHRPPAGQLTGFYLWMSVGGVLGGIFAALLAPLLFSTILEYPVLLVLALLCRPPEASGTRWHREAAVLLIGGVLLALPSWLGWAQLPDEFGLARFLVVVALALGIGMFGKDKGVLAGLTAATLIVVLAWQTGSGRTTAVRSFFGVHKIVDAQDGRVRLLFHGTTIHGAQRLLNEDGTPATGMPEKLTYYFDGGAMVEAISAVRLARRGLEDVAVVGLGAARSPALRHPAKTGGFSRLTQKSFASPAIRENSASLTPAHPMPTSSPAMRG